MNINEFIKKHYGSMTMREIARHCKVSDWYVRCRVKEFGLSTLVSEKVVDDIDSDIGSHKEKKEKRSTDTKYKELLERVEIQGKEINVLRDIKQNRDTFRIEPKKEGLDGQATAIWLASDWHVGEKVTFAQTNGINEYNPDISLARGTTYFQHALKLTNMFGKDVDIDTVVLALLGDFITGHLHLDAVENNYMAPVEEALYAKQIIASGIQFVLDNSKYKLVIPCASGNHGRTTKFSHFGSENGHSLEYFMYVSLRDQFAGNKRVEFIISEGAHTYVEVYNYPVRFLHGHDMKYGGGVGGLTVPVNKAIAQWDKARRAYLTCFGHFHQRFDGGNFLANGSMIGYNAFALSIKASAEAPAQQMCLIDRKRGKTVVAPILFT